MAKNRFINTKFWSDNFIIQLNPLDRYLFLYLLTNEHTNIAGIYELPLVTMAFETGIDKEMLPKMIKRLKGKIYYFDGWVYVKNFERHQVARGSSKVKIGIEKVKNDVPQEILDKIANISKKPIGYQYPMDSTSALDSDSDLDSDTDSDMDSDLDSDTNGHKKIKKKRDDQILVEYYFKLKGWTDKPQKELYAVFPRYIKTARQILELAELAKAKAKMDRLKTWADNNELDWSLETMIKKWLELDDLPQEKKKRAFIDGDRAYQKGDEWWVILKNGEHKKYAGSLNKLTYE